MHERERKKYRLVTTFHYTLRRYHLGTSTRRVADTEFEASVSIFSESDGEHASDVLPGSTLKTAN